MQTNVEQPVADRQMCCPKSAVMEKRISSSAGLWGLVTCKTGLAATRNYRWLTGRLINSAPKSAALKNHIQASAGLWALVTCKAGRAAHGIAAVTRLDLSNRHRLQGIRNEAWSLDRCVKCRRNCKTNPQCFFFVFFLRLSGCTRTRGSFLYITGWFPALSKDCMLSLKQVKRSKFWS